MPDTPAIALLGEARGEFLFLTDVAAAIRERLGPDSVVQIEQDPLDLTDEERATVLVPCLEPHFRTAAGLRGERLVQAVEQAERRFGIPSLRRLWQGDLAYWRDGVSEEELARQALGYLEVFDALYERRPGLLGGYTEESARLLKRTFRAVSVARGRRLLAAFTVALPNRLLLIDQEEPRAALPAWETFEPTGEELAAAAEHIRRVVSSDVGFVRPRDLRLTLQRIRNFSRLAVRQISRREPGSRNTRLGYFTRDYLVHRIRSAVLDATTSRTLDADRVVFYPVQFTHDSQLTVRGEAYRNQLALIERLAESVPFGYTLVVKPHPASPGDVSSLALTRLARTLPNVRVVHPSLHPHEILRRARAMVTANSTTGFEALMFGVPTVTLGTSIYRGLGLTVDVTDPGLLRAAIAGAVHGPPPDPAGVERLIAYCMRVSHPIVHSALDSSAENARAHADVFVEVFGLECAAAESPGAAR